MMAKVIVYTAIYHNFLIAPNFFLLALLGILAHIYIMTTLVIIYHYCNIKCGKEA